MKTLRFIGVAIIAVIMSVNFTACGDDEDDGDPINKWVGKYQLLSDGNKFIYCCHHFDMEGHAVPNYCEFVNGEMNISSDGTLTLTGLANKQVYKSYDEHKINHGEYIESQEEITITGKLEMNNGMLTVILYLPGSMCSPLYTHDDNGILEQGDATSNGYGGISFRQRPKPDSYYPIHSSLFWFEFKAINN